MRRRARVGCERRPPGQPAGGHAGVRLALGAAGQRAGGHGAIGEDLVAGAEGVDRGPRVLELERSVVALVDRGHRGEVAGAEALEAADVELAVGGDRAAVAGVVGVDPGLAAEALEQLVAAAHPAGDVGADEHPVAAGGLEVEEVVEGGDRLEVGGGDAHHRGDLADALGGAPAVAALDREERRDRGGALLRVAGHDLEDLVAEVVGDGGLVHLGDLDGGGLVDARVGGALGGSRSALALGA